MKKRALLLGLAVALLVVVPAAAGMTVGDRISVLGHTPAEFGAGDPFHVKHGHALLTPQDDGPVSGWLFELEVDGAYVRHSFIDVAVIKDEDGNVTQTRWWVFNFPDGLPVGPHEFIGHWSSPCMQTEEACDRPNEPIETFTTSHTVDFNFICRDALGCVTYAAWDPVNLGTSLSLTGAEFFGIDELRGVEIALDDHGDLFGHDIALVNADSMCSPEGGETAANAIVANPSIAAVVGTTCSSAALVGAPILSDAGYSMVSPSNTLPALTDPGTHSLGYLRVAWNDRDQAVLMAEFVRSEGASTSAVVVDGSLFSTSLADAFVERFEDLGGNNIAYETAQSNGSDAAAVIDNIGDAGPPDVLYLPVFEPPGSALVVEARSNSALDGTQIATAEILADQGIVDGIVEAIGEGAEGMLFTTPDSSFTDTPEYAAFAATYSSNYSEGPRTLFSPLAYDAARLILSRIEAVGEIDGDGTLHIGRQALRDALFATSGFEGLSGTIACSPLGDCAGTGFTILTVVDGELVPLP